MTTVHDSTNYVLRPRRRPRDIATMKASSKAIFELPSTTDFLTGSVAARYFASKLALPVIETIDSYNHNMNGVDRADQLRGELRTNRTTCRSWLPYFFFLLDTAIVNAYLLWRWECEKLVYNNSRKGENQRTHRIFRKALISSLIKRPLHTSRPLVSSTIRVGPNHSFIRPNRSWVGCQYHTLDTKMKRGYCYYCRFQAFKGEIPKCQIKRTRKGCSLYKVPLCRYCFRGYHGL